MPAPIYLLDTNTIIEAVRTATWIAITGGLVIGTVAECVDECGRGDRLSSGCIRVSPTELSRLSSTYTISDEQRAAVLLVPEGAALDDGERDLFAHALACADSCDWRLCSPDLASIRFAVAAGAGDNVIALEELVSLVGARPSTALRSHFSNEWLATQRTKAILGVPF